jgi:hypothetical protein
MHAKYSAHLTCSKLGGILTTGSTAIKHKIIKIINNKKDIDNKNDSFRPWYTFTLKSCCFSDKFFAVEGLEILLLIRHFLLTVSIGVKHDTPQCLQTDSPGIVLLQTSSASLPVHFLPKLFLTNHTVPV